MEFDASCKRAQFIDKSVEIRTMFQWAAPAEVMRALKLYLSSFYGAMLWDLSGEKARQVYTAWNTAVKLTWECPRETKTFLLQNVLSTDMTTARTDILGRYSKFISRDLRSTTGENLKTVA